ncbi:putative XRE-type DNA-binding protein [Nitrobacteraceae bacterium AZCC 2161]
MEGEKLKQKGLATLLDVDQPQISRLFRDSGAVIENVSIDWAAKVTDLRRG